MLTESRSGNDRGHGPARFWAVDLHVHTPASQDVKAEKYGASSPAEIVEAAMAAGLDAIAITDHNTVDWCDPVAQAAEGYDLVVLPGVELSTTEGHLLGIWEVGTSIEKIKDVIVSLGIARENLGKLEINTRQNIADAARIISASGGLAIAAHGDRDKGLLGLSVKSHVRQTLLEPALAAVEVADPKSTDYVLQAVENGRELACTRGSDGIASGKSWHSLEGIGARRTWIKASRPDLCGLRHAFEDPSLRVRLIEPDEPEHMIIRSAKVSGGFFDDCTFQFSPDLNCLLGGTGTGKSLLVEVIRFALGQQTSADDFPQVRREVESRLAKALGNNAAVEVEVQHGNAHYTVRRAYCGQDSPPPDVVGAANALALEDGLIPIRAFSQGEVIEFARTPVGRMPLVDTVLDLSDLASAEEKAMAELVKNADEITDLRNAVSATRQLLTSLPETSARLKELEELFDSDIIKQQEKWSQEKARLGKLDAVAFLKEPPSVKDVGKFTYTVANESNRDLYQRAEAAYGALRAAIDEATRILQDAFKVARVELAEVAADWRLRSKRFDEQVAEELSSVDAGKKGLRALKKRLSELQTAKAELDDAHTRMQEELLPSLERVLGEREQILDRLIAVRRERRNRRRKRIKRLNGLMSGVVRIKLVQEGDHADYNQRLASLAKGSHLRADILRDLASKTSPVKLVRSYLEADPEGVAKAAEVEVRHVEKLFDWVEAHDREHELLELQGVDLPDHLAVEFRRSGSAEYEPIELLAHGEKCTAILIIAMADGTEPLVIDQPEDALHAPWIEEHLVPRLRELRGGRQYIFATRSPGLVVSADAEMITTLTSSATTGRVEASGSLERHDLNELSLYHLEGGPWPFRRRTKKLAQSMQ